MSLIKALTMGQQGEYNNKMRMIKDSCYRMSTNRDPEYREQQMLKVAGWLEEMTAIMETLQKEV